MKMGVGARTAGDTAAEIKTARIPRAAKRRWLLTASIAFMVLSMSRGALAGNPGNATAGKATFQARCVMCHGADASGHTLIAKSLGTIPDYRSTTVQSLTDTQIRAVITDGKGKMPPARGLSETEIANLIAFIRSLAKK